MEGICKIQFIDLDEWSTISPLKEVIQPHLPVLLPCYDFTLLTSSTLNTCFLSVSSASSGNANSGGVTGGVYKSGERIHRSMLICDY